MMSATSKKEEKARAKAHQSQMESIEQMMESFEEVFEVAGESLDELDKELIDTFLNNRKRDLKEV